VRAKKRLAYAQGLIEEIGLERERLELVVPSVPPRTTIDRIARDLLAEETKLAPSPLRVKERGEERRTGKEYRQEGVRR
jgi:coenzyme F420-reducing hydrogenase delta subunit